MQYIQIPYTEWVKSFNYTNGYSNQSVTNTNSLIDNSSYYYQSKNTLPLATDEKSPDNYDSKPQVFNMYNFYERKYFLFFFFRYIMQRRRNVVIINL